MKLKKELDIKTDFWEGTMSDIAFLLIIFFILTAVFSVPYILRLNTGTSTIEYIKENELVIIEVDSKGKLFLNKNKITKKRLEKSFVYKNKYRIRIADNRPYQEFIDILNILYSANINEFEVITRK